MLRTAIHPPHLTRLAAALLLTSAILQSQIIAPQILQRPEPVYDASLTEYLLNPTRIELTIDEKGSLFALQSSSGLPDNVVQALRQWRFQPGTDHGRNASFVIAVDLQLRIPVNRYSGSSSRPAELTATVPKAAENAAWKKGTQLTPVKAAELERKLKDSRESRLDRLALLSYAAARNDTDAMNLRVRQLSWLIRNQPDVELLGTAEALVPRMAAGYETLKTLWEEQVAKDPANAAVLGHATWFLKLPDPGRAEELLIPRTKTVSWAAAWLGELYAEGVLGEAETPSDGFKAHARTQLETTSDGRIVLAALSAIAFANQRLTREGKLPSDFADVCGAVLARAKALHVENQLSCEPEQKVTSGNAAVRPAQILRKIAPVYPDDAKSHRIEGTVYFSVIIGTDGKIHDPALLRGPVALYEATRKAISGWEYSPTTLDGKPVDVQTVLEITYSMQQ